MRPGKLKEKLNSEQVGSWSLGDPGERMVLTAGGSFLVDLLYALYHGALGVREGSVWFVTLCVYYALLGAVRFGAVFRGRKGHPSPGTEGFITGLSGDFWSF